MVPNSDGASISACKVLASKWLIRYFPYEFVPKINEDEFPPPSSVTPYPEATKITVGDAYYALSKWLPAGKCYSVMVSIGFPKILYIQVHI